MSDALSFAEFDGQHVELLPTRTVLSLFSGAGGVGGVGGSGTGGIGLNAVDLNAVGGHLNGAGGGAGSVGGNSNGGPV